MDKIKSEELRKMDLCGVIANSSDGVYRDKKGNYYKVLTLGYAAQKLTKGQATVLMTYARPGPFSSCKIHAKAKVDLGIA